MSEPLKEIDCVATQRFAAEDEAQAPSPFSYSLKPNLAIKMVSVENSEENEKTILNTIKDTTDWL